MTKLEAMEKIEALKGVVSALPEEADIGHMQIWEYASLDSGIEIRLMHPCVPDCETECVEQDGYRVHYYRLPDVTFWWMEYLNAASDN